MSNASYDGEVRQTNMTVVKTLAGFVPTWLAVLRFGGVARPWLGCTESLIGYSEIMPIVFSHVSTSCGQFVIGRFVRRSPNACPPCAYRCISTGTPAFFSAM